jgi:transposase-like protein
LILEEETTMTDATIALAGMAELADKGPDVDMLRQMVQFMAQRLMDMDVESLCGAGYDEKSAERLNSRNGFRERSWETRTGTVALKIPKLRQGSYFPASLSRAAPPRRRWPRSSRRPTCTACPRGPWTIWSRPWA